MQNARADKSKASGSEKPSKGSSGDQALGENILPEQCYYAAGAIHHPHMRSISPLSTQLYFKDLVRMSDRD